MRLLISRLLIRGFYLITIKMTETPSAVLWSCATLPSSENIQDFEIILEKVKIQDFAHR